MIDANALFAIGLFAVGGAYSLWLGRLRKTQPDSQLALMASPDILTMMLVQTVRGTQEADQIRDRLAAPERMRRSGQYYSTGGYLLLTGVVLQIVLVIGLRVQ